ELKDYQGAIADFNKAIEFGPQYAYAYYNRGITKSTLGHYREAIADFGMAIEIDPKDSAAYYNRAILNMN
ncbi:MAG: tetratricopeptide repeat protein, partial [Prochlorococcus sp.]